MSDRVDDLLRSARSDGPSGAEAARLRAALGIPRGGGGGDGGAAPRPNLASSSGLGTPTVAAVGVIAVSVVLVWLAFRGEEPAPPPLAPSSVAARVTSAPAPTPPPAARALPEAAPVDLPSAPEPASPRAFVPRSAPSTDPNAEAELLERARAALSTSPATAWRLARQHERRYPAGVLVQEREVLAIHALVRLGRLDEGRARADHFRTQHPRSIHGRRVEAILAAGPPPAP